jgi:hypothetical protein
VINSEILFYKEPFFEPDFFLGFKPVVLDLSLPGFAAGFRDVPFAGIVRLDSEKMTGGKCYETFYGRKLQP